MRQKTPEARENCPGKFYESGEVLSGSVPLTLFEEMKRLSDLINHLLTEVRCNFEDTVQPDLMQGLWSVFQSPLLEALDIVDRQRVVRVTTPSKRVLFQIISKTGGENYIAFPSTDYCSCLAFRYLVLKQDEYPMCKHVLAARLAEAMQIYEEKLWTESQFSQSILTID